MYQAGQMFDGFRADFPPCICFRRRLMCKKTVIISGLMGPKARSDVRFLSIVNHYQMWCGYDRIAIVQEILLQAGQRENKKKRKRLRIFLKRRESIGLIDVSVQVPFGIGDFSA